MPTSIGKAPKSRSKQQVKADQSPGRTRPKLRANSGMPTEVQIVTGQRDNESLSAVMREWLVPMLVKEFLAEKRTKLAKTPANAKKRTTGPLGMEGAARVRIS